MKKDNFLQIRVDDLFKENVIKVSQKMGHKGYASMIRDLLQNLLEKNSEFQA